MVSILWSNLKIGVYYEEILMIYGVLCSSSDLQITQRKWIYLERIKFMNFTLKQLSRLQESSDTKTILEKYLP